ncbi:MAG: hypothetical protein RL033_4906 [Pseudomonadota bacterium]|jgi:hypothetical protein
MKKATRIIGYVLVVSGLNMGLAAAQSVAPASNKFIPAKPVAGVVTGIVLSGIRPLLDSPVLGFRPVIDPPTLGFRPVTDPPLRPLIGVPRPGDPILGVFKPLTGIQPKPGIIPTLPPYPTIKPITLSDVNGYDR